MAQTMKTRVEPRGTSQKQAVPTQASATGTRASDSAFPRPGAEASAAPPAKVNLKHYRIAVSHLTQGMFVADLDRLWIDTPFLMQSFLISSKAELDALRRYCRYVYVDLDLSNADFANEIRAAAIASLPLVEDRPRVAARRKAAELTAVPNEPERKRAIRDRPRDSRAHLEVTRSTRERFAEFVGLPAHEDDKAHRSWFGNAREWVSQKLASHAAGPAAEKKVRKDIATQPDVEAIRKLLPPSVELRPYEDTTSVVEELPRARSAFKAGADTINTLIQDIRNGRVVKVKDVSRVVDDMVESMIHNPDALMWVARLRDEDVYAYNHGVKVALYLVALGRHLGFPKRELANLGMIGMLADVGKTRLPRTLLDKPGMLSPAEYNIVKEHVRLGVEALSQDTTLSKEVLEGISQHHERLDGSGYPKGLSADEVGIYGRMAGLADCFAALITPRPYANPSPPQNALMNLYEWAGTSFHEPLVEQFVQAVGIFPVGSMVELSSGEVAIVLAHNRVRRLEPKVMILTAPNKTAISVPITRNLLDQPPAPDGRPLRILRGLPTGAYGLKIRDYYGAELARENKLV